MWNSTGALSSFTSHEISSRATGAEFSEAKKSFFAGAFRIWRRRAPLSNILAARSIKQLALNLGRDAFGVGGPPLDIGPCQSIFVVHDPITRESDCAAFILAFFAPLPITPPHSVCRHANNVGMPTLVRSSRWLNISKCAHIFCTKPSQMIKRITHKQQTNNWYKQIPNK